MVKRFLIVIFNVMLENVPGFFQYTQLFHNILHITKLREKHTKIRIALKPSPAYVIKVIRNLLSLTAPFGGHEDTPILHGFRGTSGRRPGKESYLLLVTQYIVL